jgi:RNA polymerase sigma factor (sigma-70 family)
VNKPPSIRRSLEATEASAPPSTEQAARSPLSPAEAQFVRELFERHQLSLYRYLSKLLRSREEAQEVLQEAYLRMIRQSDFDRLRENARAYLFSTATNLARDLFRARAARDLKSERDLFTSMALECAHWDSCPDLALEGEQTEQILLAALNTLDPQVRSALLLHRFRDMTYEQIGAQLAISVRTAKRYVREGLDVIARRLKRES